MVARKYKWYKIDDPVQLSMTGNKIHILEVNKRKISMALWNGTPYAFTYKCPHAGGILADGCIDALGNVVCPLHRYKYNIKNGYNVSGEGYYMTVYPLESREDGIYIGFEEPSIWDVFRR